LLVALVLVLPLPALAQATAPSIVILVRHAEKAAAPAADPALSPAGVARAQALAAALRDAGVTAIVTTQFKRTRDTAQPLAAARGLQPEVVAAAKGEAHAQAVAAAVRRHLGGVVLVVGHSNTVSAIIAALGGPRLPDLCDSAYSDLFVLVPGAGESKLVRSRYGAGEPGGADCN
jgi:broad specificity phosphatase PhoE